MKALRIVCGIAVLVTALHFSHAIHHFILFGAIRSGGVWVEFAVAVGIDLLAFLGGLMLLMSNR
jgi:hypothetical protein